MLTAAVLLSFDADHQKLEREARICRLLKHPNIGRNISLLLTLFISLENLGEMEINKYQEQLRNQMQIFPGKTLYHVAFLMNSAVGCNNLMDHL